MAIWWAKSSSRSSTLSVPKRFSMDFISLYDKILLKKQFLKLRNRMDSVFISLVYRLDLMLTSQSFILTSDMNLNPLLGVLGNSATALVKMNQPCDYILLLVGWI